MDENKNKRERGRGIERERGRGIEREREIEEREELID